MASFGDFLAAGPFANSGYIQSFLHPEKAYQGAQDEANRSWQEAQGFERPFMQGGLDQYGRLNEATGKLLDPMSLQNEWAKGYETSPYARQLLEQNKTSGLDTASSMGLLGSSAALGNIQQGAGNIVAQDRQNYLNDLMQKYMQGIGLGENLYGTGANMAGQLGNQSLEHGRDIAALEANKRLAPGQLFSKLAGMGLNAGLNLATGGMSGAAQGAANKFNQGSYTG